MRTEGPARPASPAGAAGSVPRTAPRRGSFPPTVPRLQAGGGPTRRGAPTPPLTARSRCCCGAACTDPPSRGCAGQGRAAGARPGAAPLAAHRPLPPAPLPARWKSPERGGHGRGRERGAAPGAGPCEGAAGRPRRGSAALRALGIRGPGPAARPGSCGAAAPSARRATARSLPAPASPEPQPKFAPAASPPSAQRSRGSSAELRPGRSSSGSLGNSAVLSSAAPFCVRLLLALTGKKAVLWGK